MLNCYYHNLLCIRKFFSTLLRLKVRDAYYAQELNINFLYSYVNHHIQSRMTECKLYL